MPWPMRFGPPPKIMIFLRSVFTGCYGLGFAKDYNKKPKEELLRMLAHPSSDRHFIMYEALRDAELHAARADVRFRDFKEHA